MDVTRRVALDVFNEVIGLEGGTDKSRRSGIWSDTICPALDDFFGYTFTPHELFMVDFKQLF